MAPEVTYGFYAGAYGGTLGEAPFGDFLPAAASLVRWLCGGREPAPADADAWRRAVCAALDALAEHGEGGGGVALGDFRATSREGLGTDGRELAVRAAGRELFGTGLCFCGVG